MYILNGKVYKDANCTQELTDEGSISIPERDGYKFAGYYLADDKKLISSTGGIVKENKKILTGSVDDYVLTARWQPVYEANFNFNGGANGTTKVYLSYVADIKNNLTMYSDKECKEEISGQKIDIPERAGYKFLGYKIDNGVTSQGYSFDNQGNFLASSNNNLRAEIITNNKIFGNSGKIYTLIACWEKEANSVASYRITLDKQGGINGNSSLYIKDEKVYKDASCKDKDELTDTNPIEIPKKDGYKFAGYFLTNNKTNKDDKVISSTGTIIKTNKLEFISVKSDCSIMAKYQPVYEIKFNFNGGANGTTKVYLSYIADIENKLTMYSDEECTNEIIGQKIAIPQRTGYKFLGYKINNGSTSQEYSFDNQGNLVDSSNQNVREQIEAYNDFDKTGITYNLDAFWEEETSSVASYSITLDKQGGINGNSSLYIKDGKIYKDANCTDELTDDESIDIPKKDGYKFAGYFITKDDKVISSAGKIIKLNKSKLTSVTSNCSITAKYQPIYEVNFNFNGGANGTTKVYLSYVAGIEDNLTMYSDEACTNEISGQKIVIPQRTGYKFLGYKINGGSPDQDDSFDNQGNLVDSSNQNLRYQIETYNKNIDKTGITYNLIASWELEQMGTVSEGKYRVEHYKEQGDKTYKIVDTENKTGEVGTTVTANKKTYEGHTYNSSKSQESGIVLADGSLVLKMYYDLNNTIAYYTVKYYKEDGEGKYTEVKEDEDVKTGTIGSTVIAKVKAYEGYMYDSEKSKGSISGEVKEDGSISGAVKEEEGLVLGVYYRKLKAPYIEITVKDETTQEVQEGVIVTLYDSTGKEIDTQITDIVGKVAFENLEKGKTYIYRIEGDPKEYKFKVTEDGKIEYINNEEDPKDDPKEDPKDNPEEKPGDNSGDSQNSGSSTNQNQISGQTDNTKAKSVIPKAGIKGKIILFVMVLLTSIVGISYIKYKRLKKIC